MGAYIKEEEPSIRPETDWNLLVRLAHIHNVVGILGYMSMTYPICPDEALKAELRTVCLNTIYSFNTRSAQAEELFGLLSENGIDHIPMKGFVLRNYYPVPELRTFGDIDLVIRAKDRAKCHALMLEHGFEVKNDWEPVYSYLRYQEYYEIHTELLETGISEKTDYRAYFRDLWPHAQPVDGHTYQFTQEFHLLYLLVHIAKHVIGSGAGIRMYLDIAMYIKRFSMTLNWKYIREELEKLYLTDFANVIFHVIKRCWEIDSPVPLKPVEEDVLEYFLDFTLSGGIFGKVGRDSGMISLKKESRNRERVSRTGTLVKRLFPAAETIQSRYTYLQDKPWLLPAAWIHRFFKTKDSWQLHAEEAQNIMSADMEEVRKIRRLYETIGL